MPINNTLPDIELPVKMKTGEEAKTDFVEHLSSIKVKLLDAPSLIRLTKYLPMWGTATWTDKPHDNFSMKERIQIVRDVFEGNILPTSQETIGLVFLISNIDLVDVTHLLRHRSFSFSAVCTADRDMRHDKCLVKNSIVMSSFNEKYCELVTECKKLYAEMVDSNEISLLDARTILPRSLESHYYVRGNIKDFMAYIKQRIDRQIQPESDNIVALKMWIEIVRQYPMVKDLIDLDAPDAFYVKTVPTGRSSNIYMPEKPRNDVFNYKDTWFLYKKERKDMLGGKLFIKLWNDLREELNEL